MSTARDYLAAVQQRADAAADGPWYEREGYVCRRAVDSDGEEFVQGIAAYPVGKSGEFIAASRTDVPRLVAALTAALDLLDEREEELGDLILPDLRALVRDIRAVITDTLTPKENA